MLWTFIPIKMIERIVLKTFSTCNFKITTLLQVLNTYFLCPFVLKKKKNNNKNKNKQHETETRGHMRPCPTSHMAYTRITARTTRKSVAILEHCVSSWYWDSTFQSCNTPPRKEIKPPLLKIFEHCMGTCAQDSNQVKWKPALQITFWFINACN